MFNQFFSQDFGSHPQNSADSNDGFSYSDLDQIEFISEAEVAKLGGYEVLLNLDLELVSSNLSIYYFVYGS